MFNRRLKQEVMEKSAKILELERKVSSLLGFQDENGKLRLEISRVVEVNATLVKSTNEKVKMLREQNEADLFFTASKIQKRILDGEDEKSLAAIYQQMAQQQSFQQQLGGMYQQQYYSSFLSQIGLGGIFR